MYTVSCEMRKYANGETFARPITPWLQYSPHCIMTIFYIYVMSNNEFQTNHKDVCDFEKHVVLPTFVCPNPLRSDSIQCTSITTFGRPSAAWLSHNT